MLIAYQNSAPPKPTGLKKLTRLSAVLLGVCLFVPGMSFANDVGVIGQTFPITEPDLLAYMKAKAQQMVEDGEWAAKMQDLQNKAKAKLENEAPVSGITPTTIARTWTLDPSITLQHTLYAPDGNVIALAGTKVNPLERVSLNETLIFFDARDKAQTAWAKSFLDSAQGQIKPILVGGDWITLSKAWQRQVYVDVNGTISHRLQITHVPSVVTQQGHFLEVKEEVAS